MGKYFGLADTFHSVIVHASTRLLSKSERRSSVARGHARPFSAFFVVKMLVLPAAGVPSGLHQSLFTLCLRSDPSPTPGVRRALWREAAPP